MPPYIWYYMDLYCIIQRKQIWYTPRDRCSIMPIRSRKVIFLPFCTLCQGARARGLARTFSAQMLPLIEMLGQYEVNIVQMPCPELGLNGLDRAPKNIEHYRIPDFEQLCRELSASVVALINGFTDAGYSVIALVGMERSPSCSLGSVKEGGMVKRGKGVFMEHIMGQLPPSHREIFTLSLDEKKLEDGLGVLRDRLSSFENVGR